MLLSFLNVLFIQCVECVICTCLRLRCCDSHTRIYVFSHLGHFPAACSFMFELRAHEVNHSIACNRCGVCVWVFCCIIHIKSVLYVYCFTCLTLPFIPCYYYISSVSLFLRSCGDQRAHIARASNPRMALLHFNSIFDVANAIRSHIGSFNVD